MLNSGFFGHIHGFSKVGKTFNALATLPGRIVYIMGEPRSIDRTLAAIKETGKEIELVKAVSPNDYNTPADVREILIGLLTKEANKYDSLFFDGYSYFMNEFTGGLLEDDYYASRKVGDVKRKLGGQTARDGQVYGSLFSEMIRVFGLLGKIAMSGKVVIVASLSKTINQTKKTAGIGGKIEISTDPKFFELMRILNIDGTHLKSFTVPAFDGLKFLDEYPGIVDAIGYVEKPRDEMGKLIYPSYPPTVSFESLDDDYLATWSGPLLKKTKGLLNWKAILGIKKGG